MAGVLPKRAGILRKSRTAGHPPKAIAQHRFAFPSQFRPNDSGRIVARLWRIELHICLGAHFAKRGLTRIVKSCGYRAGPVGLQVAKSADPER